MGYVSKTEVSEPLIRVEESPYAEPEYSMPEPMQNIGLVWHQIEVKEDNEKLEELLQKAEHVDVISPTWLFLKDGEGSFDSSASRDYVKRAHGLGLPGLVVVALHLAILLARDPSEVKKDVFRANVDKYLTPANGGYDFWIETRSSVIWWEVNPVKF